MPCLETLFKGGFVVKVVETLFPALRKIDAGEWQREKVEIQGNKLDRLSTRHDGYDITLVREENPFAAFAANPIRSSPSPKPSAANSWSLRVESPQLLSARDSLKPLSTSDPLKPLSSPSETPPPAETFRLTISQGGRVLDDRRGPEMAVIWQEISAKVEEAEKEKADSQQEVERQRRLRLFAAHRQQIKQINRG